LPSELAVVAVHVPRGLARRYADVDRAQVAVEWPRAPRTGRLSVRVRVRGARAGFVPVTIAAKTAGFVTTRALPAGALIAAADVVAVNQVMAPGTQPAPIAIGTVTTTALAAGDVVVVAAVTRPPPVARGAAVEVIVESGAITIRAPGRLAAAARPGETAIVRLADTGRDLRGTLVDDHRVVVEEIP
jgi:flagella basal body P-ring formation protein FlgA